jgi:hypothetical protein
MTTPPPAAHYLFPGDADVFAADGEHCDHIGCREPRSIHTLRWYRWEGSVMVAEHFYCHEHGQAFARRYRTGVEAAPAESGMGGAP